MRTQRRWMALGKRYAVTRVAAWLAPYADVTG